MTSTFSTSGSLMYFYTIKTLFIGQKHHTLLTFRGLIVTISLSLLLQMVIRCKSVCSLWCSCVILYLFPDMANLQILSVKFNSIRSLEDYLIPAFSRLIKLDLRENPLMDRPPHWKVINHQQKINTDTVCFKYVLLILLLLFSVTYVKSPLFTYRDWISYCWVKCDLLKKQIHMRNWNWTPSCIKYFCQWNIWNNENTIYSITFLCDNKEVSHY